MKKFMFSWILAGFFLNGCVQQPDETPSPPSQPITFYLQLIAEIVPFPGNKSIPTPFPEEPVTELPDPLPSEDFTFDYIDYVIFRKESQEIILHKQLSKDNKEEDDYGFYIYESLPAGEYIISVLTHSSTETDLSDDLFYQKDISDTFLGISSFTIPPDNEKAEVSVLLFRKVSRIEFIPTDNIPSAAYEFRMTVPKRYNTINILSGVFEDTPLSYEYQRLFTEEEKQQNRQITHAFYTFVPGTADTFLPEIILGTYDEEGIKIRERKIIKVPVYENRITRYTGLLYSSGSTDSEFEIDFANEGKWDEPDEHTLP